MNKAQDVIQALEMRKHPEGGHFSEFYRSAGTVRKEALPDNFTCDHVYSTSIYFLLERGEFSAFHTIRQDEIWHFYLGAPVTIHIIQPDGSYEKKLLGNTFSPGMSFQQVVPAGAAFGADIVSSDEYDFALVGCTVAPGFEFDDFTLHKREELLGKYPAHREIIEKLTQN